MKQLHLFNANLPGPFKDERGNEYYGKKAPRKRNLLHIRCPNGAIKVDCRGFVYVAYHGNMGSRLDEVKKMVDAYIPNGFEKIYQYKTFEEGSPDYAYYMEAQVPEQEWYELILSSV